MTWRGARKIWIPVCRPARTAQRWIQPEAPTTILSWSPGKHPLGADGPPWVSPAEPLRITGWEPSSCRRLDGSASPLKAPSLLFWNQCKSDCSFMFICLFVCLFVSRTWKNSRRREAADQLCCHFIFLILNAASVEWAIQAQLSYDVISLQLPEPALVLLSESVHARVCACVHVYVRAWDSWFLKVLLCVNKQQ